MKGIFFIYILVSFFTGYSQDRNSIWIFGDSAGINFGSGNPTPINSGIRSRGSCVSIANSNGELLFYAFTYAGVLGNTTQVLKPNDSLMQNGGNIVGVGWYRELVIVPDPLDTNQYYLFSVGVTNTTQEGLYYSKIDMAMNSGMGEIVQKNVQLLPYAMQDGVQAIKHGNGRDWWIFCHRWDIADNNFYRFLISPTGIAGPFIQAIGDTSFGSFLNINFSKSGEKAAIVDYHGIFEIFSFDRCTGLFSVNPFYTFPTSSQNYFDFWQCEFSPNETVLYISSSEYTSYLYQLDLTDSMPLNNRDTLWIQSAFHYVGGEIELSPEDKIYYSICWNDGSHFPFPYPDSAHYLENENLSVINFPDSLGPSCDFQPYSFYLGGKRTYWGLPNNPDCEMGPDSGSICDTLLNVQILQPEKESALLNLFYHPTWQTLFINASGLKGTFYDLSIYDLNGRKVYGESGNLSSNYFTRDFQCGSLANGMYIVRFVTDRLSISKKFIKQ